MGSAQEHRAYNVYGEDSVATVDNAVDAVIESGEADSVGEALEKIAEAYTGWEAGQS